jgi:hypothetical protein
MLDARWKGYDHTELYVLQKKNNNAMGDEYCSINKKTQNYVQEFFLFFIQWPKDVWLDIWLNLLPTKAKESNK